MTSTLTSTASNNSKERHWSKEFSRPSQVYFQEMHGVVTAMESLLEGNRPYEDNQTYAYEDIEIQYH